MSSSKLYSKLNSKLNYIAQEILSATNSLSCSIYLFNKDKSKLVLRGTTSGASNKKININSYSGGKSLTWHIANNHVLENLKNVSKSEKYHGKFEQHNGPFVGVPIIANKLICIGTIKLIRRGNTMYNDAEINLIRNYVKVITSEVDKINRKAYSNYIYEEFDVLNFNKPIYLNLFNEELADISDLNRLFKYVADQLAITIGCRSAAVFTFNKLGQLERRCQTWYHPELPMDENLKLSDDINNSVLEKYPLDQSIILNACASADGNKGRRLYIKELKEDSRFKTDKEAARKIKVIEKILRNKYNLKEGISQVLVLPLRSKNRTFGVIRIVNKLQGTRLYQRGFGKRDIEWAESLGHIIARNILRIKEKSKYNIIQTLNKSIRNTERLDEQYNQICDEITDELTSYSCCVIRKLEFSGRSLNVKGINQSIAKPPTKVLTYPMTKNEIVDKEKKGPHYEERRGVLYDVINSKVPVIIEDLRKRGDSKWVNDKWIKDNGFVSAIYLPITESAEQAVPYGTISIYTKYKFAFSEKHKKNLFELAGQVSNLMAKEKEIEKQKLINEFPDELSQFYKKYYYPLGEALGAKFKDDQRNLIVKDDYHEEQVNRLLRRAIAKIQNILNVDQVAIVRSTQDPKNYELVKSLQRAQIGTFIKLPQKLNTLDFDACENFVSADYADDVGISNDPYIQKVKQILFSRIQVTLDHYLGNKMFKPQDQSKYYLALIVLNDQDLKVNDARDRRRNREKVKQLSEAQNGSLSKYFSKEIGKAIKHLNRFHDSRFINGIADIIVKRKSLDSVFRFLKQEMEKRVSCIDDLEFTILNPQNSQLDVSFKQSTIFKAPSMNDENITAMVYAHQKSYMFPHDKYWNDYKLACYDIEENEQGKITIYITPLIYNGKVKGFIHIRGNAENAFDADARYFFDSVADQLAVGIQNRDLLRIKNELSWAHIHSYKKDLRNNVLNHLRDILKSKDLESQRFFLNEVALGVEKTIAKADETVNTILEMKNTLDEVNFAKFYSMCNDILQRNYIELKDVAFEIVNDDKSDCKIQVNEKILESEIQHLVKNVIEEYRKIAELKKVKRIDYDPKKSISIIWSQTKQFQETYIQIKVRNTGTSMPKGKLKTVGLTTPSASGSGNGLLHFNFILKEMGCLEQDVTDDKNLIIQKRFFNVEQNIEGEKSFEVYFILPVKKDML